MPNILVVEQYRAELRARRLPIVDDAALETMRTTFHRALHTVGQEDKYPSRWCAALSDMLLEERMPQSFGTGFWPETDGGPVPPGQSPSLCVAARRICATFLAPSRGVGAWGRQQGRMGLRQASLVSYGGRIFASRPNRSRRWRRGLPVSDFCNKIFVDVRIDLTGRFVADCTFDGCILELHKVLGKASRTGPLPGCVFNNCQLIGNGWPEDWPADRSA